MKSAGAAGRRRWDETPKTERGAETPAISGWAETPKVERLDSADSTVISKQAVLNEAAAAAAAARKRSRWDETPMGAASMATPSVEAGSMTPSYTPSAKSALTTPVHGGTTPSMSTPAGVAAMNLQTPMVHHHAYIPQTPEQMQAQRWEREIDERNRPLTDEELDQLIPAGYKILPPPDGYVPIRTPARKLTATPTPMHSMAAGGFKMMATPDRQGTANLMPDYQAPGNLPLMKPDDLQYFNKLLEDIDEDTLPPEEAKERKIMKLLLKIKNGTPPMRKSALRQITDKVNNFVI